MPLHITWNEIALRLALTALAGGLIGADRSRHEHPAGLRTSLLVTFAASIAMIQMNLLMPTDGRSSSSFAVLDLMRLPLGILTGVGFIGAGAILKRGDAVIGITTAATMWFATVVGLCMGGGQLALGMISTVLGCGILWSMKSVERTLYHSQRASLCVKVQESALSEDELRALLAAAHMHVMSLAIRVQTLPAPLTVFDCELRWQPRKTDGRAPPILREMTARGGVVELTWKPAGAPADD